MLKSIERLQGSLLDQDRRNLLDQGRAVHDQVRSTMLRAQLHQLGNLRQAMKKKAPPKTKQFRALAQQAPAPLQEQKKCLSQSA